MLFETQKGITSNWAFEYLRCCYYGSIWFQTRLYIPLAEFLLCSSIKLVHTGLRQLVQNKEKTNTERYLSLWCSSSISTELYNSHTIQQSLGVVWRNVCNTPHSPSITGNGSLKCWYGWGKRLFTIRVRSSWYDFFWS